MFVQSNLEDSQASVYREFYEDGVETTQRNRDSKHLHERRVQACSGGGLQEEFEMLVRTRSLSSYRQRISEQLGMGVIQHPQHSQ